MTEGTQRRLAAIVSADVVGYSRLMGADEAGTLASLRNHRSELIDGKIDEHGGRIVKTMGDGLLLEFSSVVDATQCVIDVQHAMASRNEVVDEDKRIVFRIGVHLGDLVVEGDDIFGDGINIAARLEALCEAGGVAISGTVHENIAGRIEVEFVDAGDQELKNIVRPVRVWQWTPDAAATDVVNVEAALPLPDKPSIAVLPFDNMSGDPEQEYFSDGMTEDIITALSRLRWLFVIARNSSFTYKGEAVDVKRVGQELGVRYVLEGSVRKAGQRIRVTAQLVEADTGNHVWAERYDRDLVDVFDLQDELTATISSNIDAELAASEREHARRKTTDLSAWEHYQRGMWHSYKYNVKHQEKAIELLRAAIKVAPDFAQAYAGLAWSLHGWVVLGFPGDRLAIRNEAKGHAETAVDLDDRDPFGYFALGRVSVNLGDTDRAISALRKSVELNPNFAQAHYGLGVAYSWSGQAEKVRPTIETALRLSPRDAMLWGFHVFLSESELFLGNIDNAIKSANDAIQANSKAIWPHLYMASARAFKGDLDEAKLALDEAIGIQPDLLSTAE
jgi:adenylate cyclase